MRYAFYQKCATWLVITLILFMPSLALSASPKFDPSISRPWHMIKTFIEVNDGTQANPKPVKLAVTYAIPIPTSTTPEVLPVLMELLPYRKDDSMYPVRHSEMDYFASRGFIYVYVDIRGTGGSEGVRVPYEYSDIEMEDEIQIIQKLATMSWNLPGGKKVISNGKVGLWGQSWSACASFVIAGKKARDARLAPLKTIVPVHCASNLYEGDIHYMDGIMHQDEYILSIDHENAIPSYGFNGAGSIDAYKIDADFVKNRWTAYPWSLFYLGKQLKDDFWTKRTEFFYGPFTKKNPDDFNVPVFAIGSLLDGYRDSPIEIYNKLKAKGVPVKVAMSPSTHSLMDYAEPGPQWEWRSEASKWLYYWLVDNEDGNTSDNDQSLINQNEFAMYVRQPGSDKNDVPGFWRNVNWPLNVAPQKLYLTSSNTLSSTAPGNNQTTIKQLDYKPAVGVEMGVWWGEPNASLGDMTLLDNESLVFEMPVTTEMELIGFPEVSLNVAATSKDNLPSLLANWHVRLEDVDPNGKSVGVPSVAHITGASLNGAYRDANAAPSYLQSGKYYNIKLKLHFTTWTFKPGHKIRLAINNAMYRMMWPSPHKMTTQLKVSDKDSYVTLPLIPAQGAPMPVHQYTKETHAPYTEPSDGWYFAEGGYPRVDEVKSENGRRIVTWKSDYYSNISGWLIYVELDHEFSQSETNPADTKWTGYARQIYKWIGVSDPQLWGNLYGYPSLLKPGPRVPAPMREFTLETYLDINSNATQFNGKLTRTLKDANGLDLVAPYTVEQSFNRLYQ